MKKILALICFISLVLGLCACTSMPVEPAPDYTTIVETTLATMPTVPAETVHPLYIAEEERSYTPADKIGDVLINFNPGTICAEFPDGSGQVIELEVGDKYIVNGYSYPIPDFALEEFAHAPKYTAEDGRIFYLQVIPVDEFGTLCAVLPIPWYVVEGVVIHIADETGKDLGYVSTEDRPFVKVPRR